jgi:hypothetical protein
MWTCNTFITQENSGDWIRERKCESKSISTAHCITCFGWLWGKVCLVSPAPPAVLSIGPCKRLQGGAQYGTLQRSAAVLSAQYGTLQTSPEVLSAQYGALHTSPEVLSAQCGTLKTSPEVLNGTLQTSPEVLSRGPCANVFFTFKFN